MHVTALAPSIYEIIKMQGLVCNSVQGLNSVERQQYFDERVS